MRADLAIHLPLPLPLPLPLTLPLPLPLPLTLPLTRCVQTYESKYGTPLAAALKDELSGDFRRAIVSIAMVSMAIVSVPGWQVLGCAHSRRAALMWVRALCDPAHGLETLTEQEVEGLGGDVAALGAMPDALQPYAPEAATLRTRGCNPMHQRLQPYAPEAATPRTRGCNPTHQRLQPYVCRCDARRTAAGERLPAGWRRCDGLGAAGRSKPAPTPPRHPLPITPPPTTHCPPPTAPLPHHPPPTAHRPPPTASQACIGIGTDDKKLIATICSRNKQHLGTQTCYAELYLLWVYLLRLYLLRLHTCRHGFADLLR